MKDELEILLRLYDEQASAAIHCESQRSTLTNLVVTIAVAVLGFIGYHGFKLVMLPLALFLVLLGLYGSVASMKLYERHQFHRQRAASFRDRIDEICPAVNIDRLKNEADAEHRIKFKRFFKVRLYRLWLFLHLSIVIMGIACIVIIFVI